MFLFTSKDDKMQINSVRTLLYYIYFILYNLVLIAICFDLTFGAQFLTN